MDKWDEVNLKTRYLCWLYKTTKESFDAYERKFTQCEIDRLILRDIETELKDAYLPNEKKALEKYVDEFKEYISQKENACLKLKYRGKKINPAFLFLDIKLAAVEKVINKVLGSDALDAIRKAYQEEMLKRIMQERESPKR
ncbi:MAG TPA: hypothetical protein VMD52_05750 [Patescibacteria group bacterium]|nr:hypothetical protein [Patescibacteria group bacterium]